jgi:AcrR family transcriptional regulator
MAGSAPLSLAVPVSRGPKPRHTRTSIVEASLRLLADVGVPGFNLRALARELGLSPMGLYRYFADKDELLDAVIAHVLIDVSSEQQSVPGWDQQLEFAIRGMFAALIANPGVAELCATRVPGERLDPLRRRLTDIVATAGFDGLVVEDLLRALTSYVLGFALVAAGRETSTHRTRAESFEFGLSLLMDSLRRMKQP